jgi:hypothetical protein
MKLAKAMNVINIFIDVIYDVALKVVVRVPRQPP